MERETEGQRPALAGDRTLAAVAQPWEPDWDALAEHIVHRSLSLSPGERVLLWTDPYLYPVLLDAVRAAILGAAGIEHAVQLNWSPRLSGLRAADGTSPDPQTRKMELAAQLDLLHTADVFIWLPHDVTRPATYTARQSEWGLARWRGRGLHFHWFPDIPTEPGHPVHQVLHRMYEDAILRLDYAALRHRQSRLVSAIRGKELHVSNPDGTDIRLALSGDGWYHCNDGDASKSKALRATCARDREEELPPGGVRTIPIPESVDGIISFRRRQATSSLGLNLSRFTAHLDLVFREGRLKGFDAGPLQDVFLREWAVEDGDKGRVSEIVFGTNPLLTLAEGAQLPPYYGFGAGAFRFHLGDNTESGGSFRSSHIAELFFTDATVRADGALIVDKGELLV